MTIRQCYEYILVECNKVKAPQVLLEDFIYLFNKAIQQYINGVYNRSEYNQQSSDDLGFLQTTSVIKVGKIAPRQEFNDTVWELELPKDYLHMLNCIAEFTGSDSNKSRCGDGVGRTITSTCQRLTADLYAGIINNYYMRPSHKKPYYYIINHNDNNTEPLRNSEVIPTNLTMDTEIQNGSYQPGWADSELTYRNEVFLKEQYNRISNQSTVKLEIHSGTSTWALNKVYVTYLKSPMYVSMTQDKNLEIEDNSQVLEFPDYVCYEIINITVRLLLENASDPRLQTNIPINQTIAVPGNK